MKCSARCLSLTAPTSPCTPLGGLHLPSRAFPLPSAGSYPFGWTWCHSFRRFHLSVACWLARRFPTDLPASTAHRLRTTVVASPAMAVSDLGPSVAALLSGFPCRLTARPRLLTDSLRPDRAPASLPSAVTPRFCHALPSSFRLILRFEAVATSFSRKFPCVPGTGFSAFWRSLTPRIVARMPSPGLRPGSNMPPASTSSSVLVRCRVSFLDGLLHLVLAPRCCLLTVSRRQNRQPAVVPDRFLTRGSRLRPTRPPICCLRPESLRRSADSFCWSEAVG